MGNIKIGKVFGTKLGLHFSWLLAPIVVAMFLVGHFSMTAAAWGSRAIWLTAFVTGLLFLATVIFRTLAITLVASTAGRAGGSITQLALGGIELKDKEAKNAASEFVVGAAGPIISLTVGVLCLFLAGAFSSASEMSEFGSSTPLLAAVGWLGSINIGWAIFNAIPALPLDGGRVLHAIIWSRNHKKERSRRIAARIGNFVATFFLILGAFQLLAGIYAGLWPLLIGGFLLIAAKRTESPVPDTKILSPLHVNDLMQHDCEIVQGQIGLQAFVNDHLLKTGNQYYFVAEDDRLAGMITPEEVTKMRHGEWTNKTVGQVMCTLDDFQIIGPDMSIAKAYETMMSAEVNQLPVASNNQLTGIITREDILKNVYTHVISAN